MSNDESERANRHYVKADLEDFANLDAIEDGEWGHPSRETILMQSLALDDCEIQSACTGGYQGTYLFTFYTGNYLWIIRDSYGSCALCDGLIGAEHASEYALTMMRNAYAFESENDAVEFLTEKTESEYSYRWSLAEQGIDAIDNLRGGTDV